MKAIEIQCLKALRNGETVPFSRIEEDLAQELLSEGCVPPLLLVSRYPQSKDLVTWLHTVPNHYVHFGDIDLAGIHIYLTDPLVKPLVQLIHRYQKGYDQEGYIE